MVVVSAVDVHLTSVDLLNLPLLMVLDHVVVVVVVLVVIVIVVVVLVVIVIVVVVLVVVVVISSDKDQYSTCPVVDIHVDIYHDD